MNTQTIVLQNAPRASRPAVRLEAASTGLIRAAIVVVLGWIGAMKFTSYEAEAIKGLVDSSPLTSWLYAVMSVQGTANLIGAVEIITAGLLIAGIWSARASVIGAAGATLTFLVTSSFLLSAPVWEATLGGFPHLSVIPGQFLLKDLVLVAASLFLISRSLQRIER